MQKEYYKFLDGLRAMAALWVLFHHIFMFIDMRDYLGSFYVPIGKLLVSGRFGVDIFFCY